MRRYSHRDPLARAHPCQNRLKSLPACLISLGSIAC